MYAAGVRTLLLLVCSAGIVAAQPTSREVLVENAVVRILKVTVPPDHKTRQHEHKMNRVMVYLDAGGQTVRHADGRVVEQRWGAGEALWSPAVGMHTVEMANPGPTTIVEIELLGGAVEGSEPGELDPPRVAPEMYEVAFENDQVRVIDVAIPAGAAVPMHEHARTKAVVYLTAADFESTTQAGETSEAKIPAGAVVWGGPVTHRERNRGSQAFRGVVVEIKSADKELAAWVAERGGRLQAGPAGLQLDFSGRWITDADLERIATLGRLTALDLSETGVTDAGIEALATLEGVRELKLRFAEEVTEYGLAHLAGWSELERLDLRGTAVRSGVFERIAPLGALRELDVSHTRVTDEGCDRLAEFPRLERLAIGSNRLDGTCLTALKAAPALRSLDVGGVQRVDSGIWGLPLNRDNLARLGELTRLEELLLGGATITDAGSDRPGLPNAERSELPYLELLANLKELTTLDISRQPVTAGGLVFLAELPRLQRLNLGQCFRLGDEAVEPLARLGSLRELILAGTQISDDGLALLAAQASPDLRRLAVGGSRATAEGVTALRAERPALAVTWFKSEKFRDVRAAQ